MSCYLKIQKPSLKLADSDIVAVFYSYTQYMQKGIGILSMVFVISECCGLIAHSHFGISPQPSLVPHSFAKVTQGKIILIKE